MKNAVKRIFLTILIATILIAPSMAMMQAHASETPPQPPDPVIVTLPAGSQTTFFIKDWGTQPPILFESEGPGPGDVTPSVQPSLLVQVQLPPLPGIKGNYYEVRVTGDTGGLLGGKAQVCVHYDPTGMTLKQQKNLRLFIGDPVDLNGDGTVNVLDVIIMLKAIQSGANNPRYDMNHDGVVNFADLLIVVQFATHGLLVNQGRDCDGQIRLPWMDITSRVDTVNHYVCGFTGHFSGFGVH
jgi:hypothetical protein